MLTALAWGYGLTCLFVPTLPAATVGVVIVKALAVVHTLECAIFFRALKDSGEPLPANLAGVFVFGVFHYMDVKNRTLEAEPAS